jgi:citrate synthase
MKAIIEIEGQEYYTMREACAVLGIKPASLYAYVSRGRLRSYRQGMRRQRLYLRSEVDALAKLSPSRAVDLPPADSWVDIH